MIWDFIKTVLSSFTFWTAMGIVGATALIGCSVDNQTDYYAPMEMVQDDEEKPVRRDEVFFCKQLAPKYNAELEVKMWDKSRVDLLNDTHSIEADWAKKWCEGVGQCLYYSIQTGKKPGLLLLCQKNNGDEKYIYRAQAVCAKHNIDLFIEWVEK